MTTTYTRIAEIKARLDARTEAAATAIAACARLIYGDDLQAALDMAREAIDALPAEDRENFRRAFQAA